MDIGIRQANWQISHQSCDLCGHELFPHLGARSKRRYRIKLRPRGNLWRAEKISRTSWCSPFLAFQNLMCTSSINLIKSSIRVMCGTNCERFDSISMFRRQGTHRTTLKHWLKRWQYLGWKSRRVTTRLSRWRGSQLWNLQCTWK